MALTRQAYAHAKYPWEYSTAELSSLFGITRSNALLTAGPMNDSGWTDAVKMLEQQLRFLSYVAWKREENFNTNEGKVTCLYTGRGTPSYYVDTITHSGGTLNRLRHWINWLRSDYGLPAWSWSSDFVAGRAVARLNHVKEMWYATGLLHVNVDWDSGKRTIEKSLYCGGGYSWNSSVVSPSVRFDEYPTLAVSTHRTIAFSENTRQPNVNSIFLCAVGDTPSKEYSGNETWHLSTLVELSNPQTAFGEDVQVSISTGGSIYPTTGSGINATWKALDLTGYHPTSGSGAVYYKSIMTEASEDAAVLISIIDGSYSASVCYLWQTVTSNPY